MSNVIAPSGSVTIANRPIKKTTALKAITPATIQNRGTFQIFFNLHSFSIPSPTSFDLLLSPPRAFAGLDTPSFQSGTYMAGKRRISKRGFSSLRKTGYEIMMYLKISKSSQDNAVYPPNMYSVKSK